MKAVIMAIAAAVAATILVSSCGNYNIVDTRWKFQRAYIRGIGSDEWKLVTIKMWKNYDQSDMVQITTDDYTYLTHSCNVVLVKMEGK